MLLLACMLSQRGRDLLRRDVLLPHHKENSCEIKQKKKKTLTAFFFEREQKNTRKADG